MARSCLLLSLGDPPPLLVSGEEGGGGWLWLLPVNMLSSGALRAAALLTLIL